MRRGHHILAVIVALLTAAALAAAIVREVAIATGDRVDSSTPAWWHRLVTDHSLTWLAIVLTAVMALVAMVCFVLALRVARIRRDGLSVWELGEDGARVTVRVEALEHLARGALKMRVPALRVGKASLRRSGDALWATVVADALGADLAGLHGSATAVVADELLHATGLTLAGLDLIVGKLRLDDGGAS
jgi:hypothetical protein